MQPDDAADDDAADDVGVLRHLDVGSRSRPWPPGNDLCEIAGSPGNVQLALRERMN